MTILASPWLKIQHGRKICQPDVRMGRENRANALLGLTDSSNTARGRSLICNQQMPKYCSGWDRRGKTSYRTTHDSFYNIHGLLAAPLQDRFRHRDPCFLSKFSISYKAEEKTVGAGTLTQPQNLCFFLDF